MSLRLAALLAALLLAAPSIALAEEPSGCNSFRWPVERERAALSAPAKVPVANGGALGYDVAQVLELAPFADAGLPRPPERAPKGSSSYAGHFSLAGPVKPGVYKVTLASEGWLDVVVDGAFLRPIGFTGARGCEGARKSLKFNLPQRPISLQLSNAWDSRVGVIVTPAD